jgi:hypothetical protein
MSATAFQRRRRELAALQNEQEQLATAQADNVQEYVEGNFQTADNGEEKTIRDIAKSLGIKSWHIKGIDKLKEEIEEAQKGGE